MPHPEYVYAIATCCTEAANGDSVNLRRGDVWAADDAAVLEHPALFSLDIRDCGPDLPRRTVEQRDVLELSRTRRGLRR
jgi:hypothetical protein